MLEPFSNVSLQSKFSSLCTAGPPKILSFARCSLNAHMKDTCLFCFHEVMPQNIKIINNMHISRHSMAQKGISITVATVCEHEEYIANSELKLQHTQQCDCFTPV